MTTKKLDDHVKLGLIMKGDSGVDKTALAGCFMGTPYCLNQGTIGVDFVTKVVQLDGLPTRLMIFDTPGNSRFKSVVLAYCRNSDGVLLVYSVGDLDSFKNIPTHLAEVQKSQPGVPMILVGNLSYFTEDRKVTIEAGQALAEEYNIPFIETSPKSGSNVTEAFMQLASKAKEFYDLKQRKKEPTSPNARAVDINNGEENAQQQQSCMG